MKKILVIDDERNVRMLIEKFLEDYEVDSLVSAEEALKKILENNTKYDLIITDLKLPGKSGLELIRELRKNVYNCPILVVSAYVKPEILSEMFKYENVDFLSKPFTKDELQTKVKELLEEEKESFDKSLRIANKYLETGDLNKAEKMIKQMFAIAPSSPIPHYLMYELLKKRGNATLAEKHLKAAKALDEVENNEKDK
ncbi:histidine kinase [Thermosipho melanesiensis]|uniref:Response regulator receiver protein n=2 Tax=Thermosipho melanesiensis TaxID=46541 RepID=A6LMG1_THEM4|nr:response regulator [Thermosipho melanesiensis]ABR31112.1 response regulator receiver protein [Thermosipho melanesiensis BI429]APT74203.1 histidine kinase [Thermosipho melanesiensis]OOC36150.1 histidine kinase [Thermosipho melanesiensis]OOC36967.1 histidine kinase [Thermosipho melanesiensis]OOC37719.1 histidine kinase [Thermosipho melanesiensis]